MNSLSFSANWFLLEKKSKFKNKQKEMNDMDTKMNISNSELGNFHSFQFNSTSLWKAAGYLSLIHV